MAEVYSGRLVIQDGYIPESRQYRYNRSTSRPQDTFVHGRRSTYTNQGCRCDDCRRANREAIREYRQRNAIEQQTD
jgi:hypothetical protein